MASEVKWIYFYYINDKLVYVGQTADVIARLAAHAREDARYRLVDKMRFLSLPADYNKEQVDIMESLFIYYLKPSWNRTRFKFFTLNRKSVKTIISIAELVKSAGGWVQFTETVCEEFKTRNGVIAWE